ncbi:MAG: efflux RND transporter permease subunit [Flavobacteriales bacterium]|nr:efflux RND transporter permease subunit [Flavobacteriales bacterium]
MAEQGRNRISKEFFLSTLSIKNKTTVLVITAIIVFLGIFSYNNMPKASFPDIVMAQIYVGTPYPGNSPVDIEKMVTRPLEKEINTIAEVTKLTSTSIQGYSMVLVEFGSETTVDEALRKVKDAVDKARSNPSFPDDLPAEPSITEVDFSEFPILNINLSGNFSAEQLKEYAEYLEDEIEGIDEISKVNIRGLQTKEVEISVDMHKIEALKLGFNDISSAIANENVTISGGDILVGGTRRTVRAVGDFKSMEDIENIIIKQEKFNIVYLRDVADVAFKFEERTSYAREFQKPVVMLDVIKKAGKNLLSATAQIEDIIKESKVSYLPSDLDITVTNDQSAQTKSMVKNLENSIIMGILLVVVVLLFFLGFRNALFVGMAIPLSMFTSFVVLDMMGYSINMMVLFGMILALGMLVDNGIVIVENVYRLMDEGLGSFQAAKEGAGEVAWAIIASTATTLAAFLPLIFWPGMMGEFMGILPITLMIVLGSSLFVGLVINTVFTSLWMKLKEVEIIKDPKPIINAAFILGALVFFMVSGQMAKMSGEEKEMAPLLNVVGSIAYMIALARILFRNFFIVPTTKLSELLIPIGTMLIGGIAFDITGFPVSGNILITFALLLFFNVIFFTPYSYKFQKTVVPWLEEKYSILLSYVMSGKKPAIFFISTIVLLFVSFSLVDVFKPKVLFFPANMPKYVNVFIELPIGTDIKETNEATKELEILVIDELKQYEVTEDGETFNFLIESVIANAGDGTSDPNAGPQVGKTPHKARISVSFVDFQYRRDVNTRDVMENIRTVVKDQIPGVRISVDKDAAGPPTGPPINIEVTGADIDLLVVEAEKVKRFINSKNIPGIDELKLDIELAKPELIIEIDRGKARRLNLSTAQIASTIRTSLYGKEISQFKDGEDDYPIQVRFADKYRYDIESLMNQRITFRDQTNGKIQQVPISSVAKVRKSSTYSAIKRKNMDRVIFVSSTVTEGYNGNEIVQAMKDEMNNYELPMGVTVKFTGEQEEQAKEMAFLGGALLLAVFLIFLIIVSQFNSFGTPFIILSSVVLSFIGVVLGLIIFQMDFIIIMTMIGIISLAGVVVNNAIVLIDYTMLIIARRKEELGLNEDDRLPDAELIKCIIEGGKTRLRPVLLTAITTVLGLIPLATGFNIDFFSLFSSYDADISVGGDNVVFWGPMSWTVIFGLTFATFLTLVITPAMFLIKERWKTSLMGGAKEIS